MTLEYIGFTLVEIGTILVLSLGVAHLLRKFDVPMVLGLIVGGLSINFFLLLTYPMFESLTVDYTIFKQIITDLALAWIGFEIGTNIDIKLLKQNSKKYGMILLGQAIFPFLLITVIFYYLLQDLAISLILGAIAMATAPAATSQILKEYDSQGELTQTILFIVALDDILCILFVNISLGMIEIPGSNAGILFTILSSLVLVSIELIYSIIVAFLGSLAILVLIKIAVINESTILEWLLGFSLLIIALALFNNLSVIITMFVWGLLLKIAQDKREYKILQEQIEKLDVLVVPVLLLFFILIGLSMEIEILLQTGTLIFAFLYFIVRFIGKGAGSFITSFVSGANTVITNYLPFSLLTQAGVAIGLAGLAYQSLMSAGRVIDANFVINIVGISVILSELLGPVLLRFAITKSGEGSYNGTKKELIFD